MTKFVARIDYDMPGYVTAVNETITAVEKFSPLGYADVHFKDNCRKAYVYIRYSDDRIVPTPVQAKKIRASLFARLGSDMTHRIFNESLLEQPVAA